MTSLGGPTDGREVESRKEAAAQAAEAHVSSTCRVHAGGWGSWQLHEGFDAGPLRRERGELR